MKTRILAVCMILALLLCTLPVVSAADFDAGESRDESSTLDSREADIEAPVISFDPYLIRVPAGTVNMLTVEATDNVDEVTAVLTWSEGTFDSRGRFTAGSHILTITATDLSGNIATKSVIVMVMDSFKVVGTLTCDTE